MLLSFAEKAEREEDVEIAAIVVPTDTIRELVQEVKDRRYIEKHPAIRERGLHTLE